MPSGGKRDKAGRKNPGYNTKTIAFRVPVELVDKIKEAVKQIVSDFKGGV